MKEINFFSLKFENDKLIFINQTKLPFVEEYVETSDYLRIVEGIKKLEIRGAPAIGIAAAYALSLSILNVNTKLIKEKFYKAFEIIASSRPTAVNLIYALNELKNVFESNENDINIYQKLLLKAKEIHNEDIEKCNAIAKNGLKIFNKKSKVLTHCNTGILATGGEGTALAVIKEAFNNNLIEHVFADETRPLLQGSRLTSFELEKSGIPFTVNCDSSAAHLIKNKKIDLIITGADRIASNGDSANKIGTLQLAIISNYYKIPFYIAAPTTTIDFNIKSGEEIPIEERNKDEIIKINGIEITKDYPVNAPAFDITPAELISGIITEIGLFKFPYSFSQ